MAWTEPSFFILQKTATAEWEQDTILQHPRNPFNVFILSTAILCEIQSVCYDSIYLSRILVRGK